MTITWLMSLKRVARNVHHRIQKMKFFLFIQGVDRQFNPIMTGGIKGTLHSSVSVFFRNFPCIRFLPFLSFLSQISPGPHFLFPPRASFAINWRRSPRVLYNCHIICCRGNLLLKMTLVTTTMSLTFFALQCIIATFALTKRTSEDSLFAQKCFFCVKN